MNCRNAISFSHGEAKPIGYNFDSGLINVVCDWAKTTIAAFGAHRLAAAKNTLLI
jgi:hypothetical protein